MSSEHAPARGQPHPNRPTKRELYELYWGEELNQAQIGERIGVDGGTISVWMADEDIPTRGRGPAPDHTADELLSWIDAFVTEFGVVPSRTDLHGWPGPSSATYRRAFGTFTNAIREAGYEPRGGTPRNE